MESRLEDDLSKSLYEQLLLQAGSTAELDPGMAQLGSVEKPKDSSVAIKPQPGFCIKTKSANGEKIFLNICKGEQLPTPREISDEELMALLESEDPTGFRIPMSLGEAHAEVDRAGQGCTAYDIVVSPMFFQRVEASEVLMGFFLTLVLEGIEDKYGLTLDRDWKMLKNKKFMGMIPEQNIRQQSKPLIQEMVGEDRRSPGAKSLITEVSSSSKEENRAPEPAYTIIQEPPDQYPEFLVAEIHLPKVKSAATVTVDIGEDRIVLQTRSRVYGLDIFLPYNLIQAECAAQFNRNTKILALTMPVVPPT